MVITYETVDGDTFVHITSTDGIIGHAKELNAIPAGTFLTMPSKLTRAIPWLIKKCNFEKVAIVLEEHDVVVVLRKN